MEKRAANAVRVCCMDGNRNERMMSGLVCESFGRIVRESGVAAMAIVALSCAAAVAM